MNGKHYNPFSNCWIDKETLIILTNYFHHAERLNSKSRREYIRNQLAILTHWNKLNYRVKIELKKDIVAYIGTIEIQKIVMEFDSIQSVFDYKNSPKKEEFKKIKTSEERKTSEYRIGGFKQYFIPRLKKISLKGEDNEYAKVVHAAPL